MKRRTRNGSTHEEANTQRFDSKPVIAGPMLFSNIVAPIEQVIQVSLERVSGFRVQGSGFRVRGSGFRVQGSGFQGSGFRVQGSEFGIQGSGFRVQSSGVRVVNTITTWY